MKKRVLGIDLGIASIGWAIVDLEEEKFEDSQEQSAKYKITDGKIIASGTRIFQEPVDRQKKSLARIRGEARRQRATVERKKERLKYFIKISKKYNVISDNFSINSLLCPKETSCQEWNYGTKSPWALRSKALDEKINNFELFRILYHIANHRGFYFLTKAERESDGSEAEDKKVKGGLKQLKQKLEDSGLRTIGEFLYKECKQRKNNKNSYEASLRREDLIDEVKKIFATQRSKGNSLPSDFENEYINNVLLYNHLNEDNLYKMMGTCELIKDKIRAPKEGYENELFVFYNRLNNLSINRNKQISQEQRDKIFNLALLKEKVSFSDLREVLSLDEEKRFNLCSYREFNPECEKAITIKKDKLFEIKEEMFDLYDVKTGEITSNCWQCLKETIDKYFEKYAQAKQIKYFYTDLRKKLQIDDTYRFSTLKKNYCLSQSEIGLKKYLAQFEKEIFVSLKGYHKIKKELQNDFDKVNTPATLNVIAETLTYHKTDETREKYLRDNGIIDEAIIAKVLELNMSELSFFCKEALQRLNAKMSTGLLFHEAKKAAGFKDEEIDKIDKIKAYDGFYTTNPTVARIIGQFRKVVNAINRTYGKDYPIDEIHIELATDVANSKLKIGKIRNGQLLYKEQKDAARERCKEYDINPDEGDNLLRLRLAEEQDFRCIYSGKGIYFGQKEKVPTGSLYYKDCDIDHIIPISRSFNDSLQNKVLCSADENRQKRNLLPYEYFHNSDKKTEEDWQVFKIRVLSSNKMQNTKKRNLLKETFTEDDMKKFISRDLNNTRYASRHIAEYLRKYFDFSQSKNSNVLDINRVRVLGGGLTSKLRHMWGLEKDRNESNKHHAQDAIVIACASFGHIYYICSVLKKLEDEGRRPGKQTLLPWATLREEIRTSIDNILVSKMERKSATGNAHKEPNNKSNNGRLIFREGANNAINVPLDSMFRYDIYKNDSEYYCVPIYVIDLHCKDFKHIIQPYQYDKDKNELEANSEDFVFSLYKDTYIEMTTKDDETFVGYFGQYNAQSGQVYLDSRDGDLCYKISTNTLEIGDYIQYNDTEHNEIKRCQIVDFDEDNHLLKLLSDKKEPFTITAHKKENKKGEDKKKYATDISYIKYDKQKKIKLSTCLKIEKYEIDPLGNKIRIKKERERFTNKIKSNAVKYAEKKAKQHKQKG